MIEIMYVDIMYFKHYVISSEFASGFKYGSHVNETKIYFWKGMFFVPFSFISKNRVTIVSFKPE